MFRYDFGFITFEKESVDQKTLYVWVGKEHSNLLEKRNSIEYEIDNKFDGNFAPPLPD